MNYLIQDYFFQDIIFLVALYKLYGVFLPWSVRPNTAFLKAAGTLLLTALFMNLLLTGHAWTAAKLVMVCLMANLAWTKLVGVRERRQKRADVKSAGLQ